MGEDADDVGAAADFPVGSLLGVIRPDFAPELIGERGEGAVDRLPASGDWSAKSGVLGNRGRPAAHRRARRLAELSAAPAGSATPPRAQV